MKRYLLIALLGLSSLSFAHKVSIFLDKEGNKVAVYGYFSDGTPAKKSEVEVYDANSGKLLIKGRTDEEGLFNFQIPKGVSKLRVVLYAGLGHKAVQTITVSQPQAAKGGETAAANENATAKTLSGGNYEIQIPSGVESITLVVKSANGQTERIILRVSKGKIPAEGGQVNKRVNKQSNPQNENRTSEKAELQKIKRVVSKETSFPWMKVFCGIGWILGIFGILSFIYGRRQT